jgi:hypothetical protein
VVIPEKHKPQWYYHPSLGHLNPVPPVLSRNAGWVHFAGNNLVRLSIEQKNGFAQFEGMFLSLCPVYYRQAQKQ